VTHFLLQWGYLALFVATLLAAMGIPTGSELVIAFAGALASGKVTDTHHHLSLGWVIAVATGGELIGSMFGYSIGRLGGRPLLERVGKFLLITHRDLDRAESMFERHGQPIAFFGRFIPLVRSFVGLGAGIAEMAAVRFVAWTAAATAIWCTSFALIGYAVGGEWSKDLHAVSLATDVIVVVVVVGVAALIVRRWREVRSSSRQVASATGESPSDS
jgi:membrane protein DedA with SNARE-associated domain